MKQKMFTKVQIGDVVVPIRYSNRATYRVGSLERPLPLSALSDKRRASAVVIQWIWACLEEEGLAKFPTPEHVGDAVRTDQLQTLLDALQQAVELSQPKNASSSTPVPSPASS